jgi:uncharacterized membrane protein
MGPPGAAQHAGEPSAAFGSILSPQQLADYERLVPGIASKLLEMAQTEQIHAHAYALEALRRYHENNRRGQIFAFILALSSILCSGILAYLNHDWYAGIVGGTTLIALVGAFLKIKARTVTRPVNQNASEHAGG